MLTYKEALKQKRESEEKAEKDKRLCIIEVEITQLSLKKSSWEKAIKEYHAVSWVWQICLWCWKKENLELLKLANGLKRAADKKHTELGAVLEKRTCLEEKSKHVKWSSRLYSDLSTIIFVVGLIDF